MPTLPPSDVPSISVRILDGFEPFLAKRGVSYDAVLEAASVERATVKDLTQTIPLAQLSAILELSAQQTREPCLGLHWAEAYTPGATGAFGYVVMSAPTLRDAMQTVARYLSLVIFPSTVSYTEDAERGTLSWHLGALTSISTTQYVSYSVAATVLRLREIAGARWHPESVDLTHRELPCQDVLRRTLGPRVEFNAAINAVHADIKSLSLKSARFDPNLRSLMTELADRLIAERALPADIVSQCQRALIDGFSRGEDSLEDTAKTMNLTPRTLQSRLAALDTTFEAVLQDTRKRLAVGYLRDSDLTLTDIALQLGFSELSAFSRATRQWFGMPPSAYRQHLRHGAEKS